MKVLDKDEILSYLEKDYGIREGDFKVVDILSEVDETEGLVNQIFQVKNNNSKHSLVIKQVLPFAHAIERETGERLYMDPERITSEAKALTFLETFWSGIAPVVYQVDKRQGTILMEDLSDYHNLRFELPKGKMYTHFGLEIGAFLASLRYYTSNLYLDDSECEELEDYFQNAYHRERMASMILGEESFLSREGIFEPEVEKYRKRLFEDKSVRQQIKALYDELVNSPSCFCHMDLHIGNILVRDREIKLIDSEFSGYGTSYMDLGRIASSFLIDYFAWTGREEKEELKAQMENYNLQIIYDLFNAYKTGLEILVPDKAEKIYRNEAQKSIKLMMLSTLLRMQSGIALSFDLSLIKSREKHAALQERAFKLTETVFRRSPESIENFFCLLDENS